MLQDVLAQSLGDALRPAGHGRARHPNLPGSAEAILTRADFKIIFLICFGPACGGNAVAEIES